MVALPRGTRRAADGADGVGFVRDVIGALLHETLGACPRNASVCIPDV